MCSVLENNEGKVIANPEGNRTTPSVVSFKNGEIIVGEAAKRQAVTNPDTVMSVKRYMGTDHKENVNGKSYTPQEISAMILQKIKKDAESFLGVPLKGRLPSEEYFVRSTSESAASYTGRSLFRSCIADCQSRWVSEEPPAATQENRNIYGVRRN